VTATLDPVTAGEVYDFAMEPRPRPRSHTVVLAALDLWCAAFGGTFELTRHGDVVVRRRVDGAEELRIETHSSEEAAETLHRIGEQLDELDPEEFRAHWYID